MGPQKFCSEDCKDVYTLEQWQRMQEEVHAL